MKKLALKERKVRCEDCGRLVRASRIVVVPCMGPVAFYELCPRCASGRAPARTRDQEVNHVEAR